MFPFWEFPSILAHSGGEGGNGGRGEGEGGLESGGNSILLKVLSSSISTASLLKLYL